MFEISEQPKEKIKIYGVEYSVSRPSVAQVRLITEFSKGTDSNSVEAVDALIEFVSGLGIPKDVIESLEIKHLTALMEHLVGAKKN